MYTKWLKYPIVIVHSVEVISCTIDSITIESAILFISATLHLLSYDSVPACVQREEQHGNLVTYQEHVVCSHVLLEMSEV